MFSIFLSIYSVMTNLIKISFFENFEFKSYQKLSKKTF